MSQVGARAVRSRHLGGAGIWNRLSASFGSADEANEAGNFGVAVELRNLGPSWLWLGSRDSNPNYLIQSQASYR